MKDLAIKAENITKIFHRTHKKSSIAGLAGNLFSGKYRENNDNIVVAVDDLSFELKTGEALGIIGNNGAGKSTLLKILCGITKPSSGKVFIDGEISAFLDMGTAMVPELTGKENIFIYGEFQGLSPATIRKRYTSIVEFSELDDFIDTPVKYYSSGMMMRLAFAVVAHSEKDILMFDEAFAVGDIFFRAKCQKWLNDLRNKNKSIILVSHSMNELANFCDRLILLDKGKIIASGSVSEVVKNYNERQFRWGKKQPLLKIHSSNTIVTEAKNKTVEEVQWSKTEAPGDGHCMILGAQLVSNGETKDGKDGGALDLIIRASLYDFAGDIGFIISDVLESRIVSDFARHHFEKEHSSFPEGDFNLEWSIPQHLLNNGIYKVSILILDSGRHIQYRTLNVVSFEIMRENEPENLFIFPLKTDHDFLISEHK
jgi:ABC-type polysaccharide/polyol phosphate transport system ATPase subunit